MPLTVRDLAVTIRLLPAVPAGAVVHVDPLAHIAEIKSLVISAGPVLVAHDRAFLVIVGRSV